MFRRLLATLSPLVLVASQSVGAAEIPKATQTALSELKLDAKILAGLDKELDVPKAWIEGAAKEKEAIILGTWNSDQFRDITAPFRERYPAVNLRYNRTSTAGRGMKVLVALGQGRVIADVTTSIADATFQFTKMKALAELRNLPGFKNLAKAHVADDGTWASFKLSYRCLGYNTQKLKKSDLPKTWDDLLTSPLLRDGKLAVSNHPNAWLLALWGGKGEKWGDEFTRKLFEVVKPQRRKEGMSALTSLTVAGEFYANLPAPEWRAEKLRERNAPIGYHCPTPVPVTVSQIVMIEQSPRKNAARLFINWMLSREGQIMQYYETSAVPIHKDLQLPQFVPFGDTIIGKPEQLRDDALLGGDMHKKMVETWNRYWLAAATK